MPLVSLTGVTVSFGERKLFEGVNLTVAQGSRMALVGPNGSGKTTLMRIMASLASPDTGSVVREKDTRISYVPQSGVVHAGCTLREEAEKAFAFGKSLAEEITALEERMGALSPSSPNADALLWKHHALQEKLRCRPTRPSLSCNCCRHPTARRCFSSGCSAGAWRGQEKK